MEQWRKFKYGHEYSQLRWLVDILGNIFYDCPIVNYLYEWNSLLLKPQRFAILFDDL